MVDEAKLSGELGMDLAIALKERRALHMAILQMLLKQSRLASQAKAGSRVSAVQVTLPVQATLPNAPARWVKPESMIKRYGQANVDAIHQWWSVLRLRSVGRAF